MRRRLPLLFAAAVFAFTFQALALEDDDIDLDDDPAIEQMQDDYDRPGRQRWSRGMGDIGNRNGMRGPGRRNHPGRHWGRGMGMGMPMRAMNRLDLTDEQEKKIVDIMTENYRQRLLINLEMRDAREKMRDLHHAEKPDHQAVIAANQALGAARGRMHVLAYALRDDLKAVLTPEQQKKWEEIGPGRHGFERDGDGEPRSRRRGGESGPGKRKK